MPRSRAARFGDILIALANDRASDLGPVLVTAPHTGCCRTSRVDRGRRRHPGHASLAALMLGGEVGRAQVALPGEPRARGGRAGRGRRWRARGAGVASPGSSSTPDAARPQWRVSRSTSTVLEWPRGTASTPSARGSSPRASPPRPTSVGERPVAQPGMPAQIGGATAVWWPGMEPAVRGIQRARALVMAPTIPTPDLDSGSLCTVSYARTLASARVPRRVRSRGPALPFPLHPRSRIVGYRGAGRAARHVGRTRDRRCAAPLALLVRFMLFKTEFAAVAPRCTRTCPVVFAPLDLQHIRMAADGRAAAGRRTRAPRGSRARLRDRADRER